MKTVFSTSMVAHVWASRTQAEGRNPNRSLYFRDSTLWSYGGHFAVARFASADLVLLTCRHYSVTTSHHVSKAWQAIPSHYTIVRCPYPDSGAAHNREWYEPQITAHLDAVNAMRPGEKVRRAKRMAQAAAIAQEFNTYLEALPASERGNAQPFPVDLTQYADQLAAMREKEAKAKLRAEKEARKRLAATVRAWVAGEPVRLWNYRDESGSALLRVNGDMVETSMGAEVPLADAVRVLAFYDRVRNGADPRQFVRAHDAAPVRLGHFQLDAINVDGSIKAGCHYISAAQIEALRTMIAPGHDGNGSQV